MYKYFLAFALISPLIGIHLMESGAFSPSVGVYGFQNGATFAFLCYAIVVAAVAWASSGPSGSIVAQSEVDKRLVDVRFSAFSKRLFLTSLLFLLIFLFAFDAFKVWTGSVAKGEFRVSLGRLGAFPNLMTKFILPALLAYSAVLYNKSSKRRGLRRLLWANFALLFIIGGSWGFKTTSIFVLLPSFLLLYWSASVVDMLKISVFAVATIVLFFFQFDADLMATTDAYSFLVSRVTVIQGDVSWLVWDQYISGQNFPNYWPTLLAAFGGNIMSFFGPARGDWAEWMLYNYDWMLTYIAGIPLENIAGGHSLTATPFSEGLIAGGLLGVAFFAVVGGLIAGRMYSYIQRSLKKGRDIQAAIASTYFCFLIFPWLNGGGVVQLFHISVWFSIGVTIFAVKFMRRSGKKAGISRVVSAKPTTS